MLGSSSLESSSKKRRNDETDTSVCEYDLIEDMGPGNYVKARELLERYRMERMIQLKKERDAIESRKKELEFLEKFLLDKSSDTTTLSPIIHPESINVFMEVDQFLLTPEHNLQDLLDLQSSEIIKLNVGGKIFQTSKNTLFKRENMLKTMLSSGFPIDTDEHGAVTIDRSPELFPIILEHLRTGSTTHIGIWEERSLETIPKLQKLLVESDFFGTVRLSKRVKEIIKEIEFEKKLSKASKTSEDKPDDTMVSTGQENADQEWIENFMSLTLTEKEQVDGIFKNMENEHKEALQLIKEKETQLSSRCGHTNLVFNVRGIQYMVEIHKIVSHPECTLNQFLNHVNVGTLQDGQIFIDRDPEIFGIIIFYLQNGRVDLPKEVHKKKQLYRECKLLKLEGLLSYFDPMRYPLETIGQDNIKIKEEEDYLRHLFATDRNNPLLKDPYIHLINVFENERIRSSFTKEDPPKHIPLLFNFENPLEALEMTERTHTSPPPCPTMCSTRAQFISQFNAFTHGIFKDMNWNNIVCAGGAVIASMLSHEKDKIPEESIDLSWDIDDTCAELEREEDTEEETFTDSDEENPSTSNTSLLGFGHNITRNQELAFSISRSPWYNSDVDLFLIGLTEQQAEEKIYEIFTLFKNNLCTVALENYPNIGYNDVDDILVVRTEHTVTFHFKYPLRPVQIILRIYKSLSEVLMGFDCDCVTFGFDGSQLFCLPRGRRAINTRCNLVDPDRQSLTYETRLVKYAKRGFRIAVPGYDEKFVKNETLIAGQRSFKYAKRYAYYIGNRSPDVKSLTGLAKLLLIRQATKYIRPHRVMKVLKGEGGTLDETEKILQENKHDYKQLIIPFSSHITPKANYETIQKTVNFFSTTLHRLPFFEFALNDVNSVLHTSGDKSSLPKDVKWITDDPGRQYIGSFKNFYKDAYTSTKIKEKIIREKKRAKYTWSWQNKAEFIPYDPYQQLIIERAFREYKKNSALSEFVISDTHYIDFKTMRQVNKIDSSRKRFVKRFKKAIKNVQ